MALLCRASPVDKHCSRRYFATLPSSHHLHLLRLPSPQSCFFASSVPFPRLYRYSRRICPVSSSSSSLSDQNGGDLPKEKTFERIPNGKAWNIIQNASSFLPQVIMASTVLAFVFPPCFTWFTNRYYAPALGFLMFAVGINFDASDFILSLQRPGVIMAAYLGQFILKPLLGVFFASLAVSYLHLPQAIGTGIILVSCVSGAQLSNYATFLVEPTMAPLSIVMTSLSTATAVFVTPALTSVLLGKRLPIDAYGMFINITQIVVGPIAAGIVINKFAATISRSIRPLMPVLSVFITSLCIGSPLAMNVEALKSPFGLAVLLVVIGFHATGFLFGFYLPGVVFWKSSHQRKVQKTISFEIGMQSSLLGLALANKFFVDPLVGLPAAISTVVMSLMGFGLVLYWTMERKMSSKS